MQESTRAMYQLRPAMLTPVASTAAACLLHCWPMQWLVSKQWRGFSTLSADWPCTSLGPAAAAAAAVAACLLHCWPMQWLVSKHWDRRLVHNNAGPVTHQLGPQQPRHQRPTNHATSMAPATSRQPQSKASRWMVCPASSFLFVSQVLRNSKPTDQSMSKEDASTPPPTHINKCMDGYAYANPLA
jgi:hypothetical protein